MLLNMIIFVKYSGDKYSKKGFYFCFLIVLAFVKGNDLVIEESLLTFGIKLFL